MTECGICCTTQLAMEILDVLAATLKRLLRSLMPQSKVVKTDHYRQKLTSCLNSVKVNPKVTRVVTSSRGLDPRVVTSGLDPAVDIDPRVVTLPPLLPSCCMTAGVADSDDDDCVFMKDDVDSGYHTASSTLQGAGASTQGAIRPSPGYFTLTREELRHKIVSFNDNNHGLIMNLVSSYFLH